MPSIASFPRAAARHRQRGFSLLELSVVLAVIGLLLGAMAVGRDLQRSAANQRLSTDFIQGWQLAYEGYFNGVGHPPGDKPTAPTGRVNANVSAGAKLCEASMINTFLAAGIRLPEGRTAGQPDRYVYLDSNGNPQEVQVCFQSLEWAEPGASVGVYVTRYRNVMVIKGVTYSLAAALDQQIDGRSDARFGRLRDILLANSTAITEGKIWPINDAMAFGSTAITAHDEDQVTTTTAYFQMMR